MGYKSKGAKIVVVGGTLAYLAGTAIDVLYGKNVTQAFTNFRNIVGGIEVAGFGVIYGASLPLYNRWKTRRELRQRDNLSELKGDSLIYKAHVLGIRTKEKTADEIRNEVVEKIS